MTPRVYRSSPGRWYVRVKHLPYHIGPFQKWGHAHAYLDTLYRHGLAA